MRLTPALSAGLVGLVGLVATATLAAEASARTVAPECAWVDSGGRPVFGHADGMAIFRRAFECAGEAKGAYVLRFDAVEGGARRTMETRKGDVAPRGRWPRETSLHAPIARSQFCDGARVAGAPVTLAPEHDGVRARPAVAVTVEAVFEGTGDLAALSATERTTVHCEACQGLREGGALGLYEGRAMVSTLTPATRLRGRASKVWFECAKRESTLAVRYFVGPDDKALGRAIRPTWVQKGLERAFKPKGEDVEFDLPLPHAELCRRAGGAKRIAWEVAGEGLLGTIGGGGRSYHSLVCR